MVQKRCVFRKISANRTGYSQNCVSPELFAQKRKKMLQSYTALIRQTEGWWIGWILEVRGVTCQERTRSELLDTLQITLREILEFDGPEVSHRTESEIEEVKASDILEFGDPGASDQTESGFEEVKIDVRNVSG